MSETKITIIYDNPTDPDVFEAAYEPEQLEAARRIPGYLRLEASKVWPKEDGSPTPAYRMIDLYYPDYAAVSTAVSDPHNEASTASIRRWNQIWSRSDPPCPSKNFSEPIPAPPIRWIR